MRLDGCCLLSANLAGADLSSSTLTHCDLREADLSGADLSGCNLTGAKLRGVKFNGIKLDDVWAEWVNMGSGSNEDRASLEDVFGCVMGKPMAQMVVEGIIDDKVWVVILTHLCRFQIMHPHHADVRLKAIRQSANASVLYLEAEKEISLAAYLFELAAIIGRGDQELADKLAETFAHHIQGDPESNGSDPHLSPSLAYIDDIIARRHSGSLQSSDIEPLKHTAFWNSEKAFVILTSGRHIWFEAASNDSLTIRPPHSFNLGIELIQGRFVSNLTRR
ncbi:MAG: pentapeptide repeat-containing protein [Blastocatellia bacterium]|nr:pentapeptide repeat-containing protein [Blastocatellia bacterium]